MRVLIKKPGGQRSTLIEVVQVMQYDDDYVGFNVPCSEYAKRYGYKRYLSTTPVDKAQYDRWCSTLLRSGYLDATTSSIFFAPRVNPE